MRPTATECRLLAEALERHAREIRLEGLDTPLDDPRRYELLGLATRTRGRAMEWRKLYERRIDL